jgi:hypothetical protein
VGSRQPLATVAPMAGPIDAPHSPEALRLGRLLDAHHPATDQVDPPLTETCFRCGSLMYTPSPEGLKHLPAEVDFARVETWLADNW